MMFRSWILLFSLYSSAASAGCCSQDYKTCINWCGSTKAKCEACGDVVWLRKGARTRCKARWAECTTSPNSCCNGLTCHLQNQWYGQCLPGSTTSSPPPTPRPTAAPVILSPVASPAKKPVVPTPAPIASTRKPTLRPVATPRPSATPVTRSPVASPTKKPVLPTPAPIAPTPKPTLTPIATPPPTDKPVGTPTPRPSATPVTPSPVASPTKKPVVPTPAPIAPTPKPTLRPVMTPPPTEKPVAPPTPSPLATSRPSSTPTASALASLTYQVSADPPVLTIVYQGTPSSSSLIVSEGQAYALLVTGAVLASWATHGGTNAELEQVKTAFYGYWKGWVRMCQNSNDSASCQSQQWCQSGGQSSVCLPHWRQRADLTSATDTGAAPDGDEDAIVGMIWAIAALADDPPSWLAEVAAWADASIASFMTWNTLTTGSRRLLKLGSCWGGWGGNGQNPSYHSPGSFKLFRDYHINYQGSRSYSIYTAADFDALIDTSYDVLFGVQCESQGMVPNWARVVERNGGITSDGGSFSGSGTPQYEFGSEAARTPWRVALDAAAYPGEMDQQAALFLDPLLTTLDSGYQASAPMSWSSNTFSRCSADNMASDIYIFTSGWLWNGFIFGPVLASLIVPSSSMTTARQQQLVDAAALALKQNLSSEYYARSWVLLGSLALNGALESASRTMADGMPPIAPVAPTPTAPAPAPVAAPVAVPVATPTSGCCSLDFKNCIAWSCGDDAASCGSCDPLQTYVWLESGALTACTARWGDCTSKSSSCCSGLSCRVQNPYWSQCEV